MTKLLLTPFLVIVAALTTCSGPTLVPETPAPTSTPTEPSPTATLAPRSVAATPVLLPNTQESMATETPVPTGTPTEKPAATRAATPGTTQQPETISPTPTFGRTPTTTRPIQIPSPTKAAPPKPTLSPTESPTEESKNADSATGNPSLQGLSELLSMVPPEFADDTLVFSFNAPEFQGDYWQFPRGRALHPEIAANIVRLKELMSLDFSNYEQGIWSWKPGNRSRTFMAFQGPMEGQQAPDRLEDLGFRETSYLDTAYYELDEDFSVDIRHQLGRTGLLFNRLALPGDSVLAAPATEIIESLIVAKQTVSQTLSASPPHSALANAAGDELVSGALFRPGWIAETWNTVNPGPTGRLERYRTGPETWGTLSRYRLALLGYRAGENADEMVIALYLSQSGDAEADSRELETRWDSYLYDPSGPPGEDDEIPLKQACFPLSVDTIQNAEYSIIVGSCPLIKNEETDSEISGPSLWIWLFNTRQLEFLIPDIDELRP